MKTLIATALLIASTASYAHDNSFSSEACHVDLHGGINIDAKQITFSKNKAPLYTISDNQTLLVQGQKVTLTAQQQALVNDYATKVRALVPEVKSLALDAIDLAIDGVNLAFNELLGQGNKVSTELTTQLTTIRAEVDREFDQNKGFYIDEEGFSGDDYFNDDFEQRIESAVENTIKNSIGGLMIALGQEMLASGGDMSAFEDKMTRFGEHIEHEMTTRSATLEQRADALCQEVIAIDNLEGQLQASITELARYNMLTTKALKQ
ncbi:Protein of unknown function [Colwellia chukchiensis]|uniref:DUF2884 family protein n=1 Tax=Colwellia chukchiensis TaxID=641665 RepID=A0A1H7FXZ5_9GAMM|nr:DUF2884 family protein [Colwellia chukchiensis]SEK30778.1 Protein of unknown function [Colwellia chukchiensis]